MLMFTPSQVFVFAKTCTAQKLMEHNPHFQTLLLPGLNHLLLPCEKGTPDEYRSIKAPLSSEVLKAVEEVAPEVVEEEVAAAKTEE